MEDIDITLDTLDIDAQDISVEVQTLANLSDLNDVLTNNLDSNSNSFVLAYNAKTKNFEFINPDSVIDSAINVGGLSTNTITYFGNTLDNEIDLDGGEF